MKHLSIIIPAGEQNFVSIAGVYELVSAANAHWVSQGKSPVFAIDLVGDGQSGGFGHGLFHVRVTKNISELQRTDLIIIPSLNHDASTATLNNGALMQWVKQQYKMGAKIKQTQPSFKQIKPLNYS